MEQLQRPPLENADSVSLPIREDILQVNRQAWADISKPGTWWTGAQRVAIAAETRAALNCNLCRKRKTALSPNAVQGVHDHAPGSMDVLGEHAIDAIHRITTDSGRITQSYVDSLRKDGVSAEHYIELLGVIILTLPVDEFHRALGLPLETLPTPLAGTPTQYRVPDAQLESETGFVPMIKPDGAVGAEADIFQGASTAGNVIRAVTLVPNAIREYIPQFNAYYMTFEQMGDMAAMVQGRALDRMQIELIASRISVLNECVYCASGHTMVLDISGKIAQEDINMGAVVGGEDVEHSGVKHGKALIEFTDALSRREAAEIAIARNALSNAMGPAAVCDAAAVAANFQRMNRIANATGIAIDGIAVPMVSPIVEKLGFDKFQSYEHTPKPSLLVRLFAPLIRPMMMTIMQWMVRRRKGRTK